jgi:preprotein translocase YajC subunit
MFATPAYAQAAGAAGQGGTAGAIVSLLPLVLIFVVFYFLMIRPQQKRMKALQDAVGGVKKGDTVVTAGGLIGKVTKVDETEVEIELGTNVKVRASRRRSPKSGRSAAASPRTTDARLSPLEGPDDHIGLALMMLLSVPSFVPKSVRETWPSWIPQPAINLGLDLAGGSYLLLEARPTTSPGAARDRCGAGAQRDAPRSAHRDRRHLGPGRQAELHGPRPVQGRCGAREAAAITGSGVGTTGQREWDIAVVDSTRFVLTPTKAGIDQADREAMNDAREVVDKRINALGTLEPTVVREGNNRIVVQVPGLRIRARSRSCSARPPSSNSAWSTPAPIPRRSRQGMPPPGSVVMPYAEAAGRSRCSARS